MVAMIEDWLLALHHNGGALSYLSEVLLLRGEVIEASSELGVPSKLREGGSRRGELSHFTVVETIVIDIGVSIFMLMPEGRRRSRGRRSESGSRVRCGYRERH
jgi:hypothetical protein